MEEVNLFMVSITAFAGVFTVLGSLALVMRIITAVFPHKVVAPAPRRGAGGAPTSGGAPADSTLLAAIATTATAFYPGMRVARIEEVQ